MAQNTDKPHHHGDLRNALVNAAISILSESGTAGLTLRKTAARAGVSHAAPTHHFGNLAGLLDAIAAKGFYIFRIDMERFMAAEADDPRAQLRGICYGYLHFAETNPALLDLMFRAERMDNYDPLLNQESSGSYGVLRRAAAPFVTDPATARIVEAQIWSMIHGYAVLRSSGRLGSCPDDPSSDVDAILTLLDSLTNAAPSQPGPSPLKGS